MSQVDPHRSSPWPDELLRELVDRLPSMVAYWDSSRRCRFANHAYVRWFGVTPEALLGKHIRELLGPLYALNLPYIDAALRGEPQEFEREIPDPAGGPSRHSLANYIPDISGGVVRGFFVLVTDISAVKRAQLALQESEERFRQTIDEAPIGMALVTTEGRFARVNRVLCEIVGYTPEELTGLTFQAITHPEDLNADLELAGRLARGEIPRYQLEKRYLRKDGTVVPVMLSGSAVRAPGGEPRYFIAQIEDITVKKRVERDQRFLAEVGPVLASSLDYDATLTRIAELAVQDLADFCIVDLVEPDGSVRRVKVTSKDPSKAWVCEALVQARLDRSRPHLTGSVMHTLRPELLTQPSADAIAARSQGEAHLHALRATNIQSMVAVPLLVRGQLSGAMAFLSSTPGRLYGEADLRLAEELGQRAALSIENARLYRSAQQAIQMRDDVLGVVAHDLRNPLNTILAYANVLGRTATNPARAAQQAQSIERAARRMNRMIQDLLEVTRMETGRLAVEPARVDARQLVTDFAESQEALAASAGVELRVELEAEVPQLWADRHRLLQILENLIGNALKFTERGGRIVIGAAPRGGEVQFRVSDTGAGIAEGDLAHIFDRFWQGTDQSRLGAGLGLAIVKGLVELHHGRIWVESTPGRGSTFYFTIPFAPAESSRQPEPHP